MRNVTSLYFNFSVRYIFIKCFTNSILFSGPNRTSERPSYLFSLLKRCYRLFNLEFRYNKIFLTTNRLICKILQKLLLIPFCHLLRLVKILHHIPAQIFRVYAFGCFYTPREILSRVDDSSRITYQIENLRS